MLASLGCETSAVSEHEQARRGCAAPPGLSSVVLGRHGVGTIGCWRSLPGSHGSSAGLERHGAIRTWARSGPHGGQRRYGAVARAGRVRDRAWHPECAPAATARSRLELALCGRGRDQPGLGRGGAGRLAISSLPSSLPGGIAALPFRPMSPETLDTPPTRSNSSARFIFAVRRASPTGTPSPSACAISEASTLGHPTVRRPIRDCALAVIWVHGCAPRIVYTERRSQRGEEVQGALRQPVRSRRRRSWAARSRGRGLARRARPSCPGVNGGQGADRLGRRTVRPGWARSWRPVRGQLRCRRRVRRTRRLPCGAGEPFPTTRPFTGARSANDT